jgi:hypothetical protein
LECTVCKTKAQLSLKRCKHFELGYDIQSLELVNRVLTAVQRRQEDQGCCACFLNYRHWEKKLRVRFVNSSFLQGKRCHGYKSNLAPCVDMGVHSWEGTGAMCLMLRMEFSAFFLCDDQKISIQSVHRPSCSHVVLFQSGIRFYSFGINACGSKHDTYHHNPAILRQSMMHTTTILPSCA